MTARKIRTYKVPDAVYYRAQGIMEEKKTPLSTFLEQVVVAISEGRKVVIHKPKNKADGLR